MKAIHSLLLTFVLLFCPAFLSAETSQALQPVMPVNEPSPVEGADVRDGNTTSGEIGRADSEDEQVQETSPEEDSNTDWHQESEVATIPDPIAPFNKTMYLVNDKLYFWLLKPAAKVYSYVVPEGFRIIFRNAYDNVKSPGRVINNILQLRLKAAGNELLRFVLNSTLGLGGLGDAGKNVFGIEKQEADFGQTLGHYGVGHGFYIVLPLFGPSSLRDTVGLVGDRLAYPLTYISEDDLSLEAVIAISTHEAVNTTSFRIGEYESFKESALDPYVSMRDAFVQHRQKKIEESKSLPEIPDKPE